MNDVLKKYLPSDHSRKVNLEYYVQKAFEMNKANETKNVLDLGCGRGESMDYFNSLNQKIEWYGIDIEKSPEVESRTFVNDRLITFDGINIPFPENKFDIIYCRQVLEHVRFPRELLAEVKRVLKPGGFFIGSTSHLEPFHSYSYWNYTPYGFSILLSELNLSLLELRHGIDSLTLIIRRGFGCSSIFNIFFKKESPLNLFISIIGKIFGLSTLTINNIKLLFCGQFIFFVTKDNDCKKVGKIN